MKAKTYKCARCGKKEKTQQPLPPNWVGSFSLTTYTIGKVYCPECWAKIKEGRQK